MIGGEVHVPSRRFRWIDSESEAEVTLVRRAVRWSIKTNKSPWPKAGKCAPRIRGMNPRRTVSVVVASVIMRECH